MKTVRTLRWAIKASFFLCLAVASSCSVLPHEKNVLKPPLIKPEQNNKYVTDEVKRGNILKKIDGMGILDPSTLEYYEFSQSGGHINEIKVKSGDKVKEGDIMIQLNVDGLDLELKQRQLDLAKKRLAFNDAKNAEDEDHLQIRRMEIDIAQTMLNDTQNKIATSRLIAKKDGVVTFVTNLKPGDIVNKFQTLVITANEKDLRIALSMDNNENMKDVKLGMEAEISYNGKNYKSKVVQTPSTAPSSSDGKATDLNNKTIFINLDNQLERPQIGQQVSILIQLASKENVLIIPLRALRTNQVHKYVQVLDGERIQEINVDTGLETATEVEIVDGLKEGQKVILQ